jgi:hypothetical protein
VRRGWVDGALIALLVLIGAGLRVYELESVPPRLSADEYTTALDVFEINAGKGPPLFGLDWKPMPALTSHLTAVLVRVTGPSILGLRLLSIVLSLAAAVLLYVLLRWTAAPGVAFAAALGLLANPWFLNFSRSGWENAHVATYWLAFTWCFFSGLRAERGALMRYAGAGLALALSCYGYFTGRLLVVAWLLFLPLAPAVVRRPWRHVLVAYALTGAIAVALFAPQIPVLVRDWDGFQRRVRNVSLLNADPAEQGYEPGTSRAAMAADQLWRTARYLTVGLEIGKVHYSPSARPPLHPVVIPFLLLGLGAAARHRRDGLWWWLLLGVAVVVTQGVSIGAPDLARLVVACPILFWFVGYGAETAVRWLPQRLRRAATVALALGALVLALVEWRYFESWMLSDGVAVSRGGGVDYREYARWQAMQADRLAHGRPTLPVVDWERPEVREAIMAGRADAQP